MPNYSAEYSDSTRHIPTFWLTSDAIINAKKLTLCWVLSHDAKKREIETESGEVLVGDVLNR